MSKNKKQNTPVQVLLTPNYVLTAGKILTAVSPFLASKMAARLFLKPFKYKLPAREKEMDRKFNEEKIIIESINRDIVLYSHITSPAANNILLVHGWSGRGTQMPDLALTLVEEGYNVYSFDAPAHGKASGKMSMMPYFIESVHHINKEHGPFHAAVGHSLGGMSLLKAEKDGLGLKKLVVIGTANSVTHITREFARNMKLNENVAKRMKSYFDKKFGEDMDNYSGAFSAKAVTIPTLVIHDKEDIDVHISSAKEIHRNLSKGELFITKGLGHRKILGDSAVINKITTFIRV